MNIMNKFIELIDLDNIPRHQQRTYDEYASHYLISLVLLILFTYCAANFSVIKGNKIDPDSYKELGIKHRPENAPAKQYALDIQYSVTDKETNHSIVITDHIYVNKAGRVQFGEHNKLKMLRSGYTYINVSPLWITFLLVCLIWNCAIWCHTLAEENTNMIRITTLIILNMFVYIFTHNSDKIKKFFT